MSDLIHSELLRLLEYRPDSGHFYWRTNASQMRAGDKAGYAHCKGYRQIRIQGRQYLAHRLAFFWVMGFWPKAQIDHINGDRSDNRWSNLREASHSQNVSNKSFARKLDLPRGVSLNGAGFSARIRKNGRRVHLGTYRTVEEAAAVYEKEANSVFGAFMPASQRQLG